MSEILTKPKDWTTQISELAVDEFIFFPYANERSIRSMISGYQVKNRVPANRYKTKAVINDGAYFLRVTREL